MITFGKSINTLSEFRNTKTNTTPTISQNIIENINNRIYFYADINRGNILILTKILKTLNNDLLYNAQIQSRDPADIYLHINSYGGNIFDGFAGMDTILNLDVNVNTVIDGACASAATFLSIAGDKRFMHEHSYILIHQLSTSYWGKYDELVDDMESNDKLMKAMKNIYKQYTKIPMKKLDEILKHDIWLTSEEAENYGLIDEVI